MYGSSEVSGELRDRRNTFQIVNDTTTFPNQEYKEMPLQSSNQTTVFHTTHLHNEHAPLSQDPPPFNLSMRQCGMLSQDNAFSWGVLDWQRRAGRGIVRGKPVELRLAC